MWRHAVHPSNGSDRPWTPEEDAALEKLWAAGGDDTTERWEGVAAAMATGRSAFQCFARFRREQVKDASSIRACWTDEEDKQLLRLVETFRTGEFVPWPKVTHHLPGGRTTEQCKDRYDRRLGGNLRNGSFLEEEDFLILAGVRLFGTTDWTRIADSVPRRSADQLSARYYAFLSLLLLLLLLQGKDETPRY
jgi:hypothetical protein